METSGVIHKTFFRLSRKTVVNCITASAKTLFPANDFGAPDWRQTAITERALEYLEELPETQQYLLRLLFVFVELVMPLLFCRFSRFSTMGPKERQALMERWATSSLYPFRLVGDAQRAVLSMLYLSHPLVLTHIGHHKNCNNPDDPLKVTVLPGVLSQPPHLAKGPHQPC